MPAWLLVPVIIVTSLIPLVIDLDVIQREALSIWHSIGWVFSVAIAFGFWTYAFSIVHPSSDWAIWLWISACVTVIINVAGVLYALDETEVIDL